MKYPELSLKPGRERALLQRHPWVFSGALVPDAGLQVPEGAVVALRSAGGDLLGVGHWAPNSPLRVRMLAFGAEAEGLTVDDAVFEERIESAWLLREEWIAREGTTGFRLINAEGDRLPGLTVDVYDDTAVVQVRTVGMLQALKPLVAYLKGQGLRRVYQKAEAHEMPERGHQASESVSGSNAARQPLQQSRWLLGSQPDSPIEFLENELAFTADPVTGQKTGFYLDQRQSRLVAGGLAHQRRVLNAYCYTGGFSVYALAGEAQSVLSVDSSRAALDLCEAHVRLNFPHDRRHSAQQADCKQFLRTIEPGAFDLIILDPPAFTKHAKTVDRAARGYKDINLQALRVIDSGGYLLTFSCSQHISRQLFQQIVFAAAADAGRSVRIIQWLGHGPDHPVDIYHPEGEYLKGLILQVE